MKINIPEEALSILESGLDMLEDIAKVRQQSAMELQLTITSIREVISSEEEINVLSEESEIEPVDPDEPTVDPETPEEPIDPEPKPEEEFTIEDLLRKFSINVRLRQEDPYANAKNHKLVTSEIEVWHALNAVLAAISEGHAINEMLIRNLITTTYKCS